MDEMKYNIVYDNHARSVIDSNIKNIIFMDYIFNNLKLNGLKVYIYIDTFNNLNIQIWSHINDICITYNKIKSEYIFRKFNYIYTFIDINYLAIVFNMLIGKYIKTDYILNEINLSKYNYAITKLEYTYFMNNEKFLRFDNIYKPRDILNNMKELTCDSIIRELG
jgi:hypothetical protein